MRKNTVHIDSLADSIISFVPQFLVPQLRLSDQDQSHRAFGIKTIIQKKPEFFQCFLLQQMSFIQHADKLLLLDTADVFDRLLQLTLGISPIKPGFHSQLIKNPLIEPLRSQFRIRKV